MVAKCIVLYKFNVHTHLCVCLCVRIFVCLYVFVSVCCNLREWCFCSAFILQELYLWFCFLFRTRRWLEGNRKVLPSKVEHKIIWVILNYVNVKRKRLFFCLCIYLCSVSCNNLFQLSITLIVSCNNLFQLSITDNVNKQVLMIWNQIKMCSTDFQLDFNNLEKMKVRHCDNCQTDASGIFSFSFFLCCIKQHMDLCNQLCFSVQLSILHDKNFNFGQPFCCVCLYVFTY